MRLRFLRPSHEFAIELVKPFLEAAIILTRLGVDAVSLNYVLRKIDNDRDNLVRGTAPNSL